MIVRVFHSCYSVVGCEGYNKKEDKQIKSKQKKKGKRKRKKGNRRTPCWLCLVDRSGVLGCLSARHRAPPSPSPTRARRHTTVDPQPTETGRQECFTPNINWTRIPKSLSHFPPPSPRRRRRRRRGSLSSASDFLMIIWFSHSLFSDWLFKRIPMRCRGHTGARCISFWCFFFLPFIFPLRKKKKSTQ